MRKQTSGGLDYLISELNGHSINVGYGMSVRISIEKEMIEEAKRRERQKMINFAMLAYHDISRMKGVPENLISENKILFESIYDALYGENE